jgi:hypothetical protein
MDPAVSEAGCQRNKQVNMGIYLTPLTTTFCGQSINSQASSVVADTTVIAGSN